MKFSLGLEGWRVQREMYRSLPNSRYGMFDIPFENQTLLVIATDGKGSKPQWEHVSVSLKNRCPNWKEMCFVKGLFWGDDETVVQFHPKASEYVNNARNVLHLWRKVGEEYELPPSIYVGIKELGTLG